MRKILLCPVVLLVTMAASSPAFGQGSPIPQAGWTLYFVDSQETVAASNDAVNAFDGNPNTIWATQWSADPPPGPHELQIDLGATYTVTGLRYLPRQDGLAYGRIGAYEIYVSADGVAWGAAAASGTFADSAGEQQVLFAGRSGRFIRLRALSEVGGNPWAVVAELNVLSTGTGSATPGAVAALVPRGSWSIHFVDSQETVAQDNAARNVFDGNPSTMWATQWHEWAPPPPHDLQIDLGASYSVSEFRYLPRQDEWPHGRIASYELYVSANGTAWGAPVASGTFPNTSSQQQVIFTPKAGRYVRLRALSEVNGGPWTTVAELNVVATGTSVPTPPPNQAPDGTIPRGSWSIRFVDSQETVANDNAARNVFDGNPSTMWATQWYDGAPPPPHELQINLGGLYDVSGFRYRPRQDQWTNGGIGVYQFYVSTDGVGWGTAVASGTFPDSSSEQQVVFTPKTGRYVRLRALTEIYGRPWTTVAELNVLGSASQPPGGGSAGQPPGGGSPNQFPLVSLTGVHNAATASVALTAAASDPDGAVTRVDFYQGSTLVANDASAPFTATVPNVGPGTHSFVAVAEDNAGDRTTSNTVTITTTTTTTRRAVFTASTDHDTLVLRYQLEVFSSAANPDTATPLAAQDLGKPAVVNSECTADITTLLSGLPPGSYIATVSAVSSTAWARSAPAAFVTP